MPAHSQYAAAPVTYQYSLFVSVLLPFAFLSVQYLNTSLQLYKW